MKMKCKKILYLIQFDLWRTGYKEAIKVSVSAFILPH